MKPYSDCTANAGTTGFAPFCSLSSATTVAIRLSIACTPEIANAPSECPITAMRVVRPGVAVRRSGERSKRRQAGLNRVTAAPSAPGLA